MVNKRSENIVQILGYDPMNCRVLFKSRRINCSTDPLLKELREMLDGYRMNRSQGTKTEEGTFEQKWTTPCGKVEALIRRRPFSTDAWEMELVVQEFRCSK